MTAKLNHEYLTIKITCNKCGKIESFDGHVLKKMADNGWITSKLNDNFRIHLCSKECENVFNIRKNIAALHSLLKEAYIMTYDVNIIDYNTILLTLEPIIYTENAWYELSFSAREKFTYLANKYKTSLINSGLELRPVDHIIKMTFKFKG